MFTSPHGDVVFASATPGKPTQAPRGVDGRRSLARINQGLTLYAWADEEGKGGNEPC